METNIVIPQKYKGKPVTRIGEKAFTNFEALESIVIPLSIKNIDDQAFENCRDITIYYEGTIEQWKKIMFGFQPFSPYYTQIIICSDGSFER